MKMGALGIVLMSRGYTPPIIVPDGSVIQNNIFATPITYSGSNVYAGYISASLQPRIAKSTDGCATWTTAAIRVAAVTNDAHDVISIGVDPNGFIHASFGMHSNPLVYSRSNSANDITAWTAINTMTGVSENTVTYPQFFNSPVTGKLYFVYRNGGSGAGTLHINIYDESAQTWSRLGAIATVIDGTATPRGPYVNNIVFDASDNIYVTWTWRNQAPVGNANLYYAKYDRAGGVWKDYTGSTYTTPITVASAVLIVTTNPRLINTCTQILDASGLHIVYAMDDGSGFSQIYHTLVNGLTITTTKVTSLSITPVNATFPDIQRPLIFTGPNNRLYILYSNGGTSVAANFVNPPGTTFLHYSDDAGATWSAPYRLRMPVLTSEYCIDYTYLNATGEARIYGQSNPANPTVTGPLYLFPTLAALKNGLTPRLP